MESHPEWERPCASVEEAKSRVINYPTLPPFHMAPPVDNRIVSGTKITVNYAILQPNSYFPTHKHEHEQITMITEGAADILFDEKIYHLEKGDAMVLVPNIEHGFRSLDKGCTIIDIFSPARPDMAAKQKEALEKSH